MSTAALAATVAKSSAPAKPAAAKPAAVAPTSAAQGDIGDDILALAARRFGVAMPATEEPAPGTEDDADHSNATEDDGAQPTAEGEETPEARTTRLQQAEGESDDDYEARLDAEGLTRDDVPAAAEPTEDEKKAAAQKARDEADLKKLPEPVRKTVQAIIEKRIGRITAKTAAERDETASRITDLEAQLAEAQAAAEGKPAQATVIGTVHPLLLDPSEKAIADYEAGVEKFEDWLIQNEDGYEPTEAELAQGFKAATRVQIRQRLREVQRERTKLVTDARAALTARTSSEAEAKKLLPALFDAKSPDYQAARSLLREQPELKRFPDYQLRLAEILLGRKALAALRTAAVKPKTATPPPRASRAPGGGSAARGGFDAPRTRGAAPVAAVQTAIKQPTIENKRAAALAVLE